MESDGEALQEVMATKAKEDASISSGSRTSMKVIRKDLIAKLPKMPREGKRLLDDLQIDVLPLPAVSQFVGELVAA